MTKMQKRIVMYISALLVLLALVSICLVGNTFARFTTNGTNSGSATVAKWNVSASGSLYGTTAISFSGDDGLSPDITSTVYDPSSDILYQYTSVKEIAEITIGSDTVVASTLGITIGDATIALNSGSSYGNGIVTYGEAAQDEVKAALSICVYYTISDSKVQNAGTKTIDDMSSYTKYTSTVGESISAKTAKYVYVWAYACWTTDYTSYYTGTDPKDYDDDNGNYYADLLDAWIGKNVASISQTISVTCVQNSEVS